MPEPSAITILRVFDAPIERVWREWTEPERFAAWFGGPDADVPPESVVMDVRAGGEWRLTMHVNRRAIDWHGTYQEVAAPSRIVFTLTDDPEATDYALIRVDLRDIGDGRTEMRFEQSGGGLTPEQAKAAGSGWSGFFDLVAERLAPG
jgi:uncharacterized protein YndB with AHSA1/START domain